MIAISDVDAKSFTIDGVTIVPRIFESNINGSGIIVLRNVFTGAKIILDTLENITLDGFPTTFKALRKVFYNFSCACEFNGDEPLFKIFDYTFDYTFE